MTTRTWLIELSKDVCEELLRDAEVGRLGVVIDGRPHVFPVSHVYEDGCVLFPTTEHTKMRAALSWPFVGFEVDGIETDGLAGWSVMVQGRAEEVHDAEVIERASSRRSAPWRTSGSLHWVRIVPAEISGRRIVSELPPVR